MTQMVLNIRDERIVPTLRKVVKAFDGVSIQKPQMTAYEKSKAEARAGKVYHAANTEEMMRQIFG